MEMNFYKETVNKIKTEKKNTAFKTARNIILALSCGAVTSSCATGHAHATRTIYSTGNVVHTQSTSFSEIDAAHANYLNAMAAREIVGGVSELYWTFNRPRPPRHVQPRPIPHPPHHIRRHPAPPHMHHHHLHCR